MAASPTAVAIGGLPGASPTRAALAAGGEAVAFQTPDGALTMRGNLFFEPGPKRRAVVIASYSPDAEADWQGFARELGGAGIASLTFQMPRYRDSGGDRDVALMDRDLESAVLFLESRDYPLIYVLGDLAAGDAALKLAARRRVAGVITVSSPVSVTGAGTVYDPRPDLPRVTVPKLFIAHQEPAAAAAVQTFAQAAPEPKQSRVFDSNAAGARLLTGPDSVSFKALVRDFLNR